MKGDDNKKEKSVNKDLIIDIFPTYRRSIRAQTTIFIIIAIMIVVAGILLYSFYPEIKVRFGFAEENPSIFMQECMEDMVNEKIKDLSLQGGSLEPEHYFLYKNSKIEYLCYNRNYYEKCVVQQALLKKHVEEELKNGIKNEIYSCLENLKKSFEKKGYEFILKNNEVEVELLPKRVIITINASLTLTKEDTKRYDSIRIFLNNNIYELVSIAESIINMETVYGDSETTLYMNYYPDLKVEKIKQSDGTTIYILTDRNTKDKFQFASRSMAWPPGY
jgi:hypothetical protein